MIYRLYEKHLVDRTVTKPLPEAVEKYLGGNWEALIEDHGLPPLDELLDQAPRISRTDLRRRLVDLAAQAATQRLDAIEQEWDSDEEIHELALDEVDLEIHDLAALDLHLGNMLLANAFAFYGAALDHRIAEDK